MLKSFSTSKEVFSWISGFINLERGQKPKSFRLERMEILTELAGNPHRCAPSIHIAGSKGKGSVTSMLAAMLTAAGLRAARYMSPHVTDIRERICLGDGKNSVNFFDEDIYCCAGDELRHIAETLLPAAVKSQPSANVLFNPNAPDGTLDHLQNERLKNEHLKNERLKNEWSGCEPTFWELLTLLFFLCARQSKCDVMVVETGMGGRLDSTNVLDPLVSVITLIELEHTAFLGKTIKEIAGEKAGIIKQDRPVILAKQCEEALEVFKNTANVKNSQFFYLPEISELSDIKITQNGTEFNFNLSSSLLCDLGTFAHNISCDSSLREPLSLSIPIPGKVQAENAALAITAIMIAFPDISEDAIRSGLANLKIPARFEKITPAHQNPFIIDGAHTPESLTLCTETFCSLYGEGGVLIFGCAADKDAAAMAKIAYNHFSKIFITTPGSFKVSDPDNVYRIFSDITGSDKTVFLPDTQEAVKQAVDFSNKGNLPILGTGSFYLVSEIRKYV